MSVAVDVFLRPAGDAPIMKKKKWAVDRNKKMSWIGEFIKKYLKIDSKDSLVRIPSGLPYALNICQYIYWC